MKGYSEYLGEAMRDAVVIRSILTDLIAELRNRYEDYDVEPACDRAEARLREVQGED